MHFFVDTDKFYGKMLPAWLATTKYGPERFGLKSSGSGLNQGSERGAEERMKLQCGGWDSQGFQMPRSSRISAVEVRKNFQH